MEQVVSRRTASSEKAVSLGNAHRRPTGRLRLMATITACALTLPVGSAWAQISQRLGQHDHSRNFDARVEVQEQLRQELPQPAQEAALEALRREVPDLLVHRDHATGAVRSLVAATGFLTRHPLVGDAESIALDFVHQHLDALGLSLADVEERELTDSVFSDISGTTHLYYRQMHQGIPVYNGQLQVNVGRDGHVLGVHNAFLPDLPAAAAARGNQPALTAAQAVDRAAAHAGLAPGRAASALSAPDGPRQKTKIDPAGLSLSPIEAELMWLPVARGNARLVWNFNLETLDGEHWYDLTVDAHTGKVWTRFDWTADATYRVYPRPVESPNHTSPTPPSDGRVLVTNPHNTTASPNGWHSTGSTSFTIPRGNNVHAYTDLNNDDLPDAGSSPDGGAGLAFNFALDLTQDPPPRGRCYRWWRAPPPGGPCGTPAARPPSTISREVAHIGRRGYRAWEADSKAVERARRPKPAKLAVNPRLCREVERQLEAKWSPQQISARLVSDYPDDAEMRVSHETIYRFIYAQIKRTQDFSWRHYLPRARSKRGWRGRKGASSTSYIQFRRPLAERSAEAADRQTPGHWEADLMLFSTYGQVVLALHERVQRAERPGDALRQIGAPEVEHVRGGDSGHLRLQRAGPR